MLSSAGRWGARVLGRWGFETRDHSRTVDAKRERKGGGGTHSVSLNGALEERSGNGSTHPGLILVHLASVEVGHATRRDEEPATPIPTLKKASTCNVPAGRWRKGLRRFKTLAPTHA